MADNFETYTVRGILKFPKFITPEHYDNATKKFIENWEKGEYGTILEIPLDEKGTNFEIMLKKIEKEHLEKIKKEKKYSENLEFFSSNFPVSIGKDKEGDSTNKKEIKFKRKAKNKKGEAVEIKFWDAKRQPIEYEELKLISTGSDARIAFMVYGWDKQTTDPRTKTDFIEYGISLCLLQAQIIKPVKNALACAFDDEFDEPEEDECLFPE